MRSDGYKGYYPNRVKFDKLGRIKVGIHNEGLKLDNRLISGGYVMFYNVYEMIELFEELLKEWEVKNGND
ncbi:hypothetical protein [Helicobacter pylori]|uniref:hypothetical protein n=1 Tax=Helicobacter pylori TaxID=210 RepID=UPI0005394829|nr:hypothetical protein [Helicobacter pylori]